MKEPDIPEATILLKPQIQQAMKSMMINIFFLIFPLLGRAQVYDEVKIYFWPEYISIAFDETSGNENHTRVRASVVVSIKQNSEVSDIEKLLTNQGLSKIVEPVTNFTCHMVIDFIKGGNIHKTIAINELYQVRMDEDRFTYYNVNQPIRTLYERFLSFFRKQCCVTDP